MIRVHVICEGQTEEMFVNQILAEPFRHQGIFLIPALIGKPGHKGGNVKFERLLADVRRRLLDDKKSYCTTFFDFYALPESFPGKEEAKSKGSIEEKSNCLLGALTDGLKEKLGDDPLRRFVPYVQMYEFEGILFSSPKGLAQGINRIELANSFQTIRNAFSSPEEINNSDITAPSKRIKKLYSGYDKPIHGSLAALEIGLDKIRSECALFDAWLKRLEGLCCDSLSI
ncbi:MAG: DUF4276 family protein [Myxococcales bacterium]|nr:DUF4276 family protein [Myxococcales bacterium]